ncbi:energy-coupled thiamine transporter ThiT [Anaerolentibacter hominis]|uniref:energy-coupled thiamine transporter ThiT n=1 Tax=Anaerolentibacter hominis TaxID=3079009 RepID=UPI0031B89E90
MWWEFFATKYTNEYQEVVYSPTTAGYIAMVLVMLVFLCLALYFGKKKAQKSITTKQLVFSAMAMALAMVTSNLKLFDMPMGGSVTLFSMFFICLIGYWYGLKAGLMTAVAYGMLQLIIDPYILSIPQLICDYPLAFGALGLSGIFSDKKNGLMTGYAVGILGRFFFSFLSGVIFFGYYAPASMNPMVYSFLYNGGYIGAEALLTLVVLFIPAVSKAVRQVKTIALA